MSVNISKLKREKLLNEVNELKDFIMTSDSNNKETLLSYIQNVENDINRKKYGLVFEEHEEEIDNLLRNHIPVLTEQYDKFLNYSKEDFDCNFLIEGDNLAALKLLCKTHKSKIDIIYIDPPYNTGNKDFIYDDSFVDADDTFKHSKWLSFMNSRLKLAKKLISYNGIIFISIDDKEYSNLKALCDEIFGETSFVSNFIWQSTAGSNTGESIVTVTEYILVYSPLGKKLKVNLEEKQADYRLSDEYEDTRGKYYLQKLDGKFTKQHFSPSLVYPIKINDSLTLYPGGKTEPSTDLWNWRWSRTKTEWGIKNGFIIFDKTKNGYVVRFKNYEKVDNDCKPRVPSVPPKNLILSSFATTGVGTSELNKILNKNVFDFPKPSCLIKKLISLYKGNNAVVLDFFAGSGTTGQAVIELNKEDGGHRKFILCTNNENNICTDITYPRLKTCITGIRQDGTKYEKSGILANLKYQKIEYINVEDKFYYEYIQELSSHIKELIELENGMILNPSIHICLTDEELDKLLNEDISELKILYLGYDLILSEEQYEILKNVEIINVPNYYYSELGDE